MKDYFGNIVKPNDIIIRCVHGTFDKRKVLGITKGGLLKLQRSNSDFVTIPKKYWDSEHLDPTANSWTSRYIYHKRYSQIPLHIKPEIKPLYWMPYNNFIILNTET